MPKACSQKIPPFLSFGRKAPSRVIKMKKQGNGFWFSGRHIKIEKPKRRDA